MRDDTHYWAVDTIRDIVNLNSEEAWPLVLELIRRAEDDPVLAFIAAGPLEDLITRHGWDVIDRVEAVAAADPKFRRALSGVWGESQMPEELIKRLKYLVRNEPPF